MMPDSAGPTSITAVRSISEIDPEAWDGLAPDNPLCSHGWLKTVEEHCKTALEPTYLLSRSRDSDRPRAATICYMLDVNDTVLTLDDLLYGRFRRYPTAIGLSFAPAAVCRPLASHGAHVWVDASASDAEADAHRRGLLDRLEAIAASRGVGLGFSCLTENETDLLAVLRERGYLETRQFPVSFLDVEWDSFSSYLDHLRAHSRKIARDIRNELNRARKTGVVVERLLDPSDWEERLTELASSQSLHRTDRPFPFRAGFFTGLLRNLGEHAHLYAAFKNGNLNGFSLMMERGGVAYVPFMGIDPERSRNDPTYFVMTYDRPIMDAIERGFSRVHFGEALYKLKQRRGCRTLRTRFCYRASSPARQALAKPWFGFHAFWMRLKLGDVEREPSRLPRPLAGDGL